MPLSVEYLVFAVLSLLLIIRFWGLKGVTDASISSIFLAVIGLIYTIDTLFPFSEFTLFQALVPTTVVLAERVLNLLHFQTLIIPPNDVGPVHLTVWNTQGKTTLGVAWPCAGVDSLILYGITIALFLKKTPIPWKQKCLYFLSGAVVTYLMNVFRISAVFIIAVNGGNYVRFHDFYGPFYSIMWIISYLVIITGSHLLWQRYRKPRLPLREDLEVSVSA
jgi:thaumarchaeosortase